MAIVTDTFTDTAGTLLNAHVGETGANWTKHGSSGAPTLVVSNAGRIYCSGLNTIYYTSGVPASAEYDVEWITRYLSTPQSFNVATAITARHSTVADTFYMARLSFDQLELYKRVAGTFTLLGSYAFTPVTNTDYAIKLEIRDATKKVYLDGVERISSTDNAITAAGRVGARGNTTTGASNTTGGHIDNLTATNPAGTVFTQTLAATSTPTATRNAAASTQRPVTSTPTAAKPAAVRATPAVTMTSTATLTRLAAATHSVQSTASATRAAAADAARPVTLSPTAELSRVVAAVRAATSTPTTSLAASLVTLRTLAVTLASSVSASRRIDAIRQITSTPAATLSKAVGASRTATVIATATRALDVARTQLVESSIGVTVQRAISTMRSIFVTSTATTDSSATAEPTVIPGLVSAFAADGPRTTPADQATATAARGPSS